MSKYSLDLFLRACGAAGPLHLIVERAGATAQNVVHQPFALVGSDPRADVRLTAGPVGRCHLYLQVLSGRLVCLDFEARPDHPQPGLPQHSWLGGGRTVRVADATIRLSDAHPALPAPGALSQRSASATLTLDIVRGPDVRAGFAIRRPLVLVGTSRGCNIRLRDAAVSRFHCALVSTPVGLWAVDLLGRGGIAVNGMVARVARLDAGDELRVGGFAFRPRPALTPDGVAPTGGGAGLVSWPDIPAGGELAAAAGALWPAAQVPAAHGASTSEALLASLVVQLSQTQQRMAEQFRLTMAGVVKAFREVHRDQMQLIRDELAMVQRLTDELASLKGELARLPLPPSPDVPAGDVPPGRPVEVAGTDQSRGPRAEVGDAHLNVSHPTADGGRSQTVPPAGGSPVDVHTWLSQRVVAVQREREGRWQKVLRFLTTHNE